MNIDTGQIAILLGVTRAHVTDKLTKQVGFPKPVINVTRKLRRWDQDAVLTWALKGTK
jgi:predicted DNA-binding transcriptional regulator AlpA